MYYSFSRHFHNLAKHVQISLLLLLYSHIHQIPTLLIRGYLVWIPIVSLQKNEIAVPCRDSFVVFLIFCRKISGTVVLEVQFMLRCFSRLVPSPCFAREFTFWLSIISWRFYCRGKSYLWRNKPYFCLLYVLRELLNTDLVHGFELILHFRWMRRAACFFYVFMYLIFSFFPSCLLLALVK